MTALTMLQRGIAALGVEVPAPAQERLVTYLQLVDKWNRVYNLTAVRNVEDMITHHLLDSLAIIPHLPGTTLLDVGSGAGLPGVPVAIARPERQVTLLDSNHKKAAFLRQAAIELGLDNVEVVCERVEAWQPRRVFDVVISRAFSELSQFIALAGRFCAPTGLLAAMKGVYPDEELGAVPRGYIVIAVHREDVSSLGEDRHLVLVQPDALAMTGA